MSAADIRRSDVISFSIAAISVGGVVLPAAAAGALGGWSALIAAYFVTGVSANLCLNLMHETAHRLTFRIRRANDLFGHGILAPMFLTSFSTYRDRHWVHHNKLGTEMDTKDTYLVSLRGARFFGFFIQSFFLVDMFRRLRSSHTAADHGKRRPYWLLAAIGFHLSVACLVGLSSAIFVDGTREWPVHFFLAYSLGYLLPIATLTPFLAGLRAIAEHQIIDRLAEPPSAIHGRAALRNLRSGLLSRLLFGSFGFAEHATHHRVPAVPCYALAEKTREIASGDPSFERKFSYWDLLAHAYRRA